MVEIKYLSVGKKINVGACFTVFSSPIKRNGIGSHPLMSYTLWPGGAIPGSGAGTGPHCRREIIKPARRVSAAPDIFGAHLYTA